MGRNKYPEETVAKILDAALELFCAQGYERGRAFKISSTDSMA